MLLSTDLTLQIARGEVGQVEVPRGSNRGPKVTLYQRVTGYTEPVPWCLCFNFWCVYTAAQQLGIDPPLVRTGSCDLAMNWARERDIFFRNPERGDVGLVLATENDAVHSFFVENIDGNSMTTIEGNTNNDGSREGFGVLRRERTRADRYRFIRWAQMAEESPPFQLIYNGALITSLPVIRNRARAPIRQVANALGISDDRITFDADAQAVAIDGRIVPATLHLIAGVSYVPIRKLAVFLNRQLDVNEQQRTITIT
jgi:hypothetical protein